MTKNEKELMYRLVGRVQRVLDLNKKLRSDCDRLRSELDEQKKLYSESIAERDRLKAQCENLKFAKAVSVSDKEVAQTKRRLSKLMREIDNCISLLNE